MTRFFLVKLLFLCGKNTFFGEKIFFCEKKRFLVNCIFGGNIFFLDFFFWLKHAFGENMFLVNTRPNKIIVGPPLPLLPLTSPSLAGSPLRGHVLDSENEVLPPPRIRTIYSLKWRVFQGQA